MEYRTTGQHAGERANSDREFCAFVSPIWNSNAAIRKPLKHQTNWFSEENWSVTYQTDCTVMVNTAEAMTLTKKIVQMCDVFLLLNLTAVVCLTQHSEQSATALHIAPFKQEGITLIQPLSGSGSFRIYDRKTNPF